MFLVFEIDKTARSGESSIHWFEPMNGASQNFPFSSPPAPIPAWVLPLSLKGERHPKIEKRPSTVGEGSWTVGEGFSTVGVGSSTVGEGSSTVGEDSSTVGEGSSTIEEGSSMIEEP